MLVALDPVELQSFKRPLDFPFPNLRSREVIKGVVEQIVETCAVVKMTAEQQATFALGMVRGARAATDDPATDRLLCDVLDRLNQGGVAAVQRLVKIVSGDDLVILVIPKNRNSACRYCDAGDCTDACVGAV